MPVKYFLCYFLFIFLFTELSMGQSVGDSILSSIKTTGSASHVPRQRKVMVKKDTLGVPINARAAVIRLADSGRASWPFRIQRGRVAYIEIIKLHPYYNFLSRPVHRLMDERKSENKDGLFYLFTGLLFFFALVRVLFNKYFNNLLSLVFRASMKQKQIREQLLQTPLPSLLLNIFFVIVGGLYVLFLLRYYKIGETINFWLLLIYCTASVGLVYVVKFVILKFTGWVFNMREATDTYAFIVFLVNKIMGMFLLPVLVLMAFAVPSWQEWLVTLSYIMVGVFFAYRYIVSFAPVRKEVKVSQFHFFMYLCAFEITPLLLIYKVLMHLL